ncbi:acyl-CoA thioesterase [Brevibacillus ruminantium]|uniref:Acyl-CoA thioesterase n=1 Tax=Brevibacillus ruminantium TaxID=2950604 RepID=A0ABY4WFD6_9BACL|nr:thioesterase family protein [Brevibacillus ruminantium]USG64838.1 acyl-CoA thioesterase [Brevibacillus ruminantium]
MLHVFDLVVRSTDIDFIGHVNNAKYLEYMEWARFDWICQKGLTLDELQRRGLLPVVVNLNINYRKELRMLERVQVRTRVLTVGEKSYVIRHEMYTAEEKLAADADVTMVMIDGRTRRAVPLPEDLASELRQAVTAGE